MRSHRSDPEDGEIAAPRPRSGQSTGAHMHGAQHAQTASLIAAVQPAICSPDKAPPQAKGDMAPDTAQPGHQQQQRQPAGPAGQPHRAAAWLAKQRQQPAGSSAGGAPAQPPAAAEPSAAPPGQLAAPLAAEARSSSPHEPGPTAVALQSGSDDEAPPPPPLAPYPEHLQGRIPPDPQPPAAASEHRLLRLELPAAARPSKRLCAAGR